MKIAFRSLFAFLFLLVIVGCEHVQTTAPPTNELRIGAAEVDITPPVGHRMAGYFDERTATGIHDPLKAKALVLKQNGETFAFVFCDLVGVSLNITTRARADASRRTGIPVPNIMICATHSHTGPLFDDVRRQYFHDLAMAKYGNDPKEKIYYPAFLADKLATVISRAQADLRPAQLEAGITQQEGVTFNRRYWMKSGKVAFNPGQLNTNIVRAAGPTDKDLSILLARDAHSHKPFAGVTVFAMHSDTVGGTQYSADYAYYLQEGLRKRFGTNFISAFGAGTCGDLNHINVNKKEQVKGLEVAERIGTTLANTFVKAADQLTPIQKPAFAVRSATIQVGLQEVTPEELADARSKASKLGDENADFMMKVIAVKRLDLAQRGTSYPMEVQVFQLDADTAIVCLPGEIFVELGLAIKQASPFSRTIVVSICNDRPSYVPTRKAFGEGSYEITNARVKPGTGEQLVDTAVELLKKLKD
jgi:hypothetical protein